MSSCRLRTSLYSQNNERILTQKDSSRMCRLVGIAKKQMEYSFAMKTSGNNISSAMGNPEPRG